jgi:hypothetical protein
VTGKSGTEIMRALCFALGLLAACTPYHDTVEVNGGHATVRTQGDLANAAARARLACGDPNKVPVLMSVSGAGEDQIATFGCM